MRQMSYSMCRFWAYDESKKLVGAGESSLFRCFLLSLYLPPVASCCVSGVSTRNTARAYHACPCTTTNTQRLSCSPLNLTSPPHRPERPNVEASLRRQHGCVSLPSPYSRQNPLTKLYLPSGWNSRLRREPRRCVPLPPPVPLLTNIQNK